MNEKTLTPEMKSTLALIGAFVAFLVVSAVLPLTMGPPDIYILSSLVVTIPYLIFLYFGTKRKPWAYLGTSLLSVLLVLATPFSIQEGMSEILVWLTVVSTVLAVLMALEGYKSYLQIKEVK